ncbi:hypothetical protein ONZ45_g7753 [Pleurotus djamor]|nr:hypothetical protein ONZ45_g7753 [Pleurotus djamor]
MTFLWSCTSFFAWAAASVSARILTSHADILPNYDFVIVGGGTAGNVLANRLTEDSGIRVLVIEAGSSNEGVLDLEVPWFQGNLAGTRYDWNFTTTPQVNLGNRSYSLSSGHVLGGSSSIGEMVYTRGSAEDYDRIANITGDIGWSWARMQPYFKKNEKWSVPPSNHTIDGQFDPSVHTTNGTLDVSLPGLSQPPDAKFIRTTQESDEFPFNLDMNSGNPLGFGWQQSTITSNGRRASLSTAYLGPSIIGRPNLDILLNHRVTRLLPMDSALSLGDAPAFNIVEFVEFINGTAGGNLTVEANVEIILSAGTINTPHILLHSGIGDRDSLSAVGVTPLHHIPDVGRNYTDYPVTSNAWAVNSVDTFEVVTRNETLLGEHLQEWTNNGTGFLTLTTSNQLGWLRLPQNATVFSSVDDPSAGPNTPHFGLTLSNGFTTTPPPTGNFITMKTTIVTPMSRGSITLNSSDPLAYPSIDPATLANDFDLFATREAIKASQRFFNSAAWDGYVSEPFGTLASVDLENNEQLDEYIRASLIAGYNPSGTAAMSPVGASWGVTDPDLSLKGIDGIRIVDASVFVE